jgi:acyl carrier protein
MENNSFITKSEIEALVFRAIDRTNQVLPVSAMIKKELSEPLAGSRSSLDSMGIVNLVASVEDEVASCYHLEINLADARGGGGDDPLETVGSLLAHLETSLRKPD